MSTASNNEPQAWIGACQVVIQPGRLRFWETQALEAIAYVVIHTDGVEPFKQLLYTALKHNGLDLVRVGSIQPLLHHFRTKGMAQDLVQLARQATPEAPVVFGRFQPLEESIPKAPEPQANEAATAENLRSDLQLETETPKVPVEPAKPEWPAPKVEQLTWESLLETETAPLWAIVDGANWPEIESLLEAYDPPHSCLYTTLDPENRAAAPWLVKLERGEPMLELMRERDQIQHSGILFTSYETVKALRDHFRLFTMLWTPADDKSPIYFRFYDPRVLMDSLYILDGWKTGRLLQPVEKLFLPLSPLMVFEEGSEQDQEVDPFYDYMHYQQELLHITPDSELPDGVVSSRKAFKISQREFEKYGVMHEKRAERQLARNLKETFNKEFRNDSYWMAAVLACTRGQEWDFISQKQVRTLSECYLQFGEDFPKAYPDIKALLEDQSLLNWQRRQALEEWMPKGIARRNIRKLPKMA
jgi:hypothetical protein